MPAKILVVEDDRVITTSISRLLARDGYYVATCESAEEALDLLGRDADFDLALLDVNLPGKDGFSCCRLLRQSGWRSPVILLTGRSGSADKVIGLEVGADDYITKPFDPQELLARIRAHLRRWRDYNVPDDQAEEIRIGPDLVVDIRTRDALVSGKPAKLTDREYELLYLLARNMGRALDKTWLFQEIWGCTPEEGLKALAVYIRRVRQKVEQDENNPKYIQTVRGFGYKLVPVEDNAAPASE